ncbi:flagellar brake protein [Aquibacillus rhizosphaerae]|uniref:Flagellar brake domain-containing protein n=1 Tax=Aquibacillus rhizosphaerae TaxID=3051431 RepID=A0ABT7L4J2_9BACI|nr:flagellar brake domain-containing protein [Aquibacillus sp. LR5S19]MDL4840783.1 flagellar brake domain-containing protein [Aquibacillus sp. LR5S19]
MIKIGTPITLEYYNEENIEKYKCKIVELEGATIYIDYPINETSGRTGIFSKGSEFIASFVGKDNSVYRFETVLKGKKTSNIPMLLLHYPENELTRIQRREYVRVMTAIDVSIHENEGHLSPFTTITYDISGGGLSIIIPENYTFIPKMLLNVWLVLPMESGKFSYINATTEVIRVNKRDGNKKDLLSLKFVEIKDKDRQEIIRYCFENQLKSRKRGLN